MASGKLSKSWEKFKSELPKVDAMLEEATTNASNGVHKPLSYYMEKYGGKYLQNLIDLAISFGSTWVPELDNEYWNRTGNVTDLLNAYEKQLAEWAAQSDTPEISRLLSRANAELNSRREQLAANAKSSASKHQAAELIQRGQSKVDSLQERYDQALNTQAKKQSLASAASNMIGTMRTSPSHKRLEDIEKMMTTAIPGFRPVNPGSSQNLSTSMDKHI